MDLHGVLVVDDGGEDLRVLGRNRRVALDQLGEQAAVGLDTDRQRRDIEQHDVLDVAAQDAALDGGADRHHLVRVDLAVGLTAEDLLHPAADHRRAGLTADQQHLVDLIGAQARLLQRVLARAFGARHQVLDQGLEVLAGERAREMARPAVVGGDEGQVDRRLGDRRELALGALGGLLQPLQRHAVVAQVDAALGLELQDQPVHDPLVEVLAAEVGVAGGRLDLEDAVRKLEHRNVEGAAAEVVDRDGLRAPPLVDAIGERRRGGLVDDAQHLEAGDASGVLGRLALRVVEVRRDGDDRLGHRLAEKLLSE